MFVRALVAGVLSALVASLLQAAVIAPVRLTARPQKDLTASRRRLDSPFQV
jgi:hypothetical protein